MGHSSQPMPVLNNLGLLPPPISVQYGQIPYHTVQDLAEDWGLSEKATQRLHDYAQVSSATLVSLVC